MSEQASSWLLLLTLLVSVPSQLSVNPVTSPGFSPLPLPRLPHFGPPPMVVRAQTCGSGPEGGFDFADNCVGIYLEYALDARASNGQKVGRQTLMMPEVTSITHHAQGSTKDPVSRG